MNSINKFCIMGRLTDDPVLRELENGTKVTNVTIAMDRDYKDKEGNKITDFINVPLWNNDAENICTISKKGSIVYLEGYNSTKLVETIDGKKENVIKPVVEVYKHIAHAKNNDVDLKNDIEEELEK